MSTIDVQALQQAYQLLQLVYQRDVSREDSADPATVYAMPLILDMPRQCPPSRAGILAAAASATVALCLDAQAARDPRWQRHLSHWYSARIRKVARRARGAEFARASTIPGVTYRDSSGAQARAIIPFPVASTPTPIRRLQISGTDLPPDSSSQPAAPEHPQILIDADLAMSVGKACAQAGHGSMMLAASLPFDEVARWAARDFHTTVREVPHEEFLAAAGVAGAVEIIDAGYTEIPPNTPTVVALPPQFREPA